jgi:hypothetical protein
MAIRSGIAAQLGIKAETTWNTFAVPDKFYEFDSESLKFNLDRVEGKGLRANNRVLRTDRWNRGKQDVKGDIEMEVLNKGFGLWFHHMLGEIATAADGAGFKHTATVGDPYGLGLTVQVGRPDASGTVRAFSYTGCKVENWEMSNAIDDTLKLRVGLDGAAEDLGQALATASYPASMELFYFTQGTITVGGSSAYDIRSWSVQNTVGIKPDRYFINGTGVKKQQIINAWMNPTGNLSAEFTDLTGYNLFVNGTLADIVLTYQTVTTYDTAKPFKIVITLKNARFDGETPNVGGPDILDFNGNFKLLNDGTNSPITIEYFTSDATP